MLGRRSALLGVALVLAVMAGAAALGWLAPLERWGLDVRTLIRFVWQPIRPTDDQIVVVAIDDRSLRERGAWPWPPDRYAQLIDRLRAAGAATIVLDFIPERSSAALEQAIRRAGHVVLATGATPDGRTVRPADDLLAMAAGYGHLHVEVDPDGVVRRVNLGPRAGAAQALSAAAVAVRMGRPVAGGVDGDGAATLWLSYRAYAPTTDRPLAIPTLQRTISAAALWSAGPDQEGLGLRGAVVLVGVTAMGLPQDRLVTSLRVLGPTPGVYVQAAAVRSLLWGDRLRRAPRSWVWFIGVMGLVVLGWLTSRRTAVAVVGGMALLTVSYLVATQWVFHRYNLWVDFGPPVLSWLLGSGVFVAAGQFQGERRNRFLRQMFGRYVSDHVVDEILRHPERIRLSGERRPVSVLFADIRGFTRLSEKLPAERVVGVLNQYLERMVAAVLVNGGLVDKYLGDGLMAIFGAPVQVGNHAKQALAAAMEMRRQIEAWRQQQATVSPDAGGVASHAAWPAIGIGLATGEAMVGSIGTAQRLEYTAIGDVVNVAARLQELAGPGEILATEVTVQQALESAQLGPYQGEDQNEGSNTGSPGAGVREAIQVRGRESPVAVCRL